MLSFNYFTGIFAGRPADYVFLLLFNWITTVVSLLQSFINLHFKSSVMNKNGHWLIVLMSLLGRKIKCLHKLCFSYRLWFSELISFKQILHQHQRLIVFEFFGIK